ncbi:MAG: DUF2934 domain-containing protein [Vicinamibacterales bacterium]
MLHEVVTQEAAVATVYNDDPNAGTTAATRSTRRDRQPAHPEPTEREVMAEASAIYPDTSLDPPTPAEIAAEAYEIYLARGARDGSDQDDWFEAERRLTEVRRGR